MENQPITNPSDISTTDPAVVNQPFTSPQTKTNFVMPILVTLLVGAVVFGFAGYYLGALSNLTNTPQQIVTETNNAIIPSSTPTMSPDVPTESSYTYNSFSFSYPNDWKFSSKNDDVNFPLKDRLTFDDEVIAISNGEIHLIVNISVADQLEAGGIFGSDKEYEEYISMHDKVAIQGSTFYLTRSHLSISSLEEEHSGPATWGALSEYVPNKTTGSGNIFKGYEQIIKRNGYRYNFIIVGQQEGVTPYAIQSDLKKILESIKW